MKKKTIAWIFGAVGLADLLLALHYYFISGARAMDFASVTAKIDAKNLIYGAIVLFVLVLIIGVMLYLKYRKRNAVPEWITYKVRNGDTLEKIAERYGVDPEGLAKKNELNPPFALEEGKRILVPGLNRTNGPTSSSKAQESPRVASGQIDLSAGRPLIGQSGDNDRRDKFPEDRLPARRFGISHKAAIIIGFAIIVTALFSWEYRSGRSGSCLD